MLTQKKGVTVKKALVLGSYAFQLSPAESRRHDRMSHKWTLLLRSANGEDPSYYVKKVLYELDASFNQHRRGKSIPPYEVTEVGWGEFYLTAKIFFVDEALDPLKLTHFLRLNPSKLDPRENITACVAAETYEEVVFSNPSEWFYEKLMAGPANPPVMHTLSPYFGDPLVREKEMLRILQEYQSAIQADNKMMEAEIAKLSEEIAKLKNDQQGSSSCSKAT